MDYIKIKEQILNNTEKHLSEIINELEKKETELNNLKLTIEMQNNTIIKLQRDKENLKKLNSNSTSGTILPEDKDIDLKIKSHLIDLLLMYFIKDTSKCMKLLEDISTKKSIFTDSFDKVTGFNLLYIALMSGENNKVIDKFKSISELINSGELEGKLYKRFNYLLNRPTVEDSVNFIRFVDTAEFIYINKDIIDIAREYLKSPSLKFLHDKIKIEEEFSLVSKKKMKCTYDGLELQEKFIFIKYYSKLKKTNKIGVIYTDAFICKSCGRVYLTDDQYIKIKKEIGDNKVKLVSYPMPIPERSSGVNSKRTVIYHEKPQVNPPIKTVTKLQNNTIKNSSDNIELNDKSKLGALGYSTTLSREERWNILKNKAIPKLGLEKTKHIINFFITYNGKAKSKQNAVVEWRHDLMKLERIIR